MATIFKREGRSPYYIVQWFDHSGRRRQKSSRTTDRRAAQRLADKLESEAMLRREGVIDVQAERLAQQDRTPILDHVDTYLNECSNRQDNPRFIDDKRRHLTQAIDDVGASRLSDLTTDRVRASLARYHKTKVSARSVNIRRNTLVAFLNWCVKTERATKNPLSAIPQLREKADRRRQRRSLTADEVKRLLAVAEERGRKAWYLAALLAGMRRGDLIQLCWGDLDFEAGTITIRNGKSQRLGKPEDVIPLPPALAQEFLRIRPDRAAATDRVFPTAVTHNTRRKDFTRAEIPLEDENGRVVDLHALRTTLGTWLAIEGVPAQHAQRILRHENLKTTMQHYTALEAQHLLPAMRLVSHLAEGKSQGQHQCQHSRHESGQSDAKSCDPVQGAHQPPDPTQPTASQEDIVAVEEVTKWRPGRDLNPCCRRERPVS